MCLNYIYCNDVTLTTNAIIIFIRYLYMYLLNSLYLLRFLVVSNFIQLESIYSILNVFMQLLFLLYLLNLYVFISLCIYSYLLGWILFLFNTCVIKFIEGKFYFEGRACYIGKIMPTCIE